MLLTNWINSWCGAEIVLNSFNFVVNVDQRAMFGSCMDCICLS